VFPIQLGNETPVNGIAITIIIKINEELSPKIKEENDVNHIYR